MRDVHRIEVFCNDLKRIWKRLPDWRFMQLMSNFFSYSLSEGRDPFFMEEDKAISRLDEYVKKMAGEEDEQ
ncbi:MAG: hypothetical protein K6C34_00445 [Alphaproteobacteria bacterium]|nr:hypothetical protein [Alphaproteobacteria bacterium]